MVKANCSNIVNMKFTEAQLKAAIIELFEAEGYPHVLGEFQAVKVEIVESEV